MESYEGSVEVFVVRLDKVPIVTPGDNDAVERYHAPLISAYKRVCIVTDRRPGDKEYQQLILIGIKSTVGSEGRCLALLVFGAIQRLAPSFSAAS